MRKFTRKTVAVAVGTALLLGGGAAFAYWTNSGTGTGTATTGTNIAITVVQTASVTAMYPGMATPVPLSGTFNNTNAGPVFIKTVAAAVTGTEKPLGTANAGCTAADYTIGGSSTIGAAAAGVGGNVPAGSAGTWAGLTITMNNTAVSQDACKDAIVKIAYTTTTTP